MTRTTAKIAALFMITGLALLGRSQAATILVSNANDSGAGSLRQAILDSNLSTGVFDTITFNIPGAGVHTITPTSPLPAITDPAAINGYSQPGASVNTLTNGDNAMLLIELDGSAAGDAHGLLLYAGGGTSVRGLVINRFAENGITVDVTGGQNIIAGNFIGTDPTGTLARGNGLNTLSHGVGVYRQGSALIGSSQIADRNVISGNGANGVGLHYSADSVVAGNYIGTTASGTNTLPNVAAPGVAIRGTNATNNVIGPGNLISGNGFRNLAIFEFASHNSVDGNLIGTDVTGTKSMVNTNGGQGVAIYDAPSNTVGTVEGNIISGNLYAGIWITSTASVANVVRNNFIGMDITGTNRLANGTQGVLIDTGARDNVIDSNLIAGNGQGVAIIDSATTNNALLGNAIFDNAALGIDLNGDGVTLNDPCDADAGPNHLQNFPVIASATNMAGNVIIHGSLNSTANQTYRLEFFANTACDPSGFGQGEVFIGFTNVTTDANCTNQFAVSFPNPAPDLPVITATATDPNGNTSEFSSCQPIGGQCQITCPANITTNVALDATSAIVDFNDPGFNGDCTLASANCLPASGSTFDIGTNTVTCSVVSTGGHTNSCTFKVIVITGAPCDSCPDLTGTWSNMVQTCKTTTKGLQCKVKGQLIVRNIGCADAPTSFVRYYLSSDATFDAGDTLLKQVATGTVKLGKPKKKTLSAKLAAGVNGSGQFIIAVIDADHTVSECNENNNFIVFGPLP